MSLTKTGPELVIIIFVNVRHKTLQRKKPHANEHSTTPAHLYVSTDRRLTARLGPKHIARQQILHCKHIHKQAHNTWENIQYTILVLYTQPHPQ